MRNPATGRPPSLPPCIAVLGPTCSGKSAVALEIAATLGGEIVSVDSMQVYRGMDVGTAKSTLEERDRVRHHLVDLLDIHQPYDAFQFVTEATQAISDIRSRGGVPLLVGGTGMYAKSLVYGHVMPPADRRLFAELTRQYSQPGGKERLEAELAAADEAAAERVIRNPRRMLRAVEILRLTGRAPSPVAGPRAPSPSFLQFVLLPPADELRAAIARRTDGMLARGWIEEAEQLAVAGLPDTPTARQALGYREILQFLAEPSMTRVDLRRVLVQRTAQFARRQRTWFRHQHPGAYLLVLRRGIPVARISRAILAVWRCRCARVAPSGLCPTSYQQPAV